MTTTTNNNAATTATPAVFQRGRYGWFYVYVAEGLRFEVGPFRTDDAAKTAALKDDDVLAGLGC